MKNHFSSVGACFFSLKKVWHIHVKRGPATEGRSEIAGRAPSLLRGLGAGHPPLVFPILVASCPQLFERRWPTADRSKICAATNLEARPFFLARNG
jgi:hypothetical protein